jgi:glyoxylase-like metal-dependent hydrolase (beta-lactamase superfamily II)
VTTDPAVPGGPPAVRHLGAATLRTLVVGPMENNAYLLTCHGTGAQLLVDAADEPERLLDLVGEGSAEGRLDLVVTTHRHGDHLGALAAVLAATGAPHAAGAADARAVADAARVDVPRGLGHGDRLQVGDLVLEVVTLRGHTPGSVALALRDGDRTHLLTGDSLFPGGPGRTTNPADFASLMTDLTERVFDRFDDATEVHPGHGLGTTLGAERPHLREWWARGW